MSAPFLPEQTVSAEYLKNLQYKIFEILARANMTQEHIFKVLDQDSMMNYWLKAFTHKSMDPENNYETLEFYGDKAMGHAFAEYVRKLAEQHGVKVTPMVGTLLTNRYISKVHQAKMAQDLGLVEFIRIDPSFSQTNIHINEDVFEAFFGALDAVSNDKISPGYGYIYIFNLITYIFSENPIDIVEVQQDYVTRLKQFFEGLKWPSPVYESFLSDDPSKGPKMVKIKSPQGDVLGTGYGTKKPAEQQAAKEALDYLATLGYDENYLAKIKLSRSRKNPKFDHQYQRVTLAIQKLNELAAKTGGSQIIDFNISKVDESRIKGQSRYTFAIQVAYQKPDGKIDWRIMNNFTGNDYDDTRIQMMKNFADKYKIPE